MASVCALHLCRLSSHVRREILRLPCPKLSTTNWIPAPGGTTSCLSPNGQWTNPTSRKRFYSRMSSFDQDHQEIEGGILGLNAHTDDDEGTGWLNDPGYKAEFENDYLLPSSGHRITIIQPDFKESDRKNHLTSPTLQLSEADALVRTLPRWTVVDKALYTVRHVDKQRLWGKGNFADITQRLRETPGLTAVMVGVNMLTGLQLATLQQAWAVPVYDRYTIVLQIFQIRARTKEAKLQVALAEIPYIRSRMRGVHLGTLGRQDGRVGSFGRGAGTQTPMEIRKEMLQNRELKLKTALQKVQNQRELLKKERKRRQIPTVAVVGYTNAGKTSLIRALSGDVNVRPRDQLFATLDVTVHEATLPNKMNVLLVDTVGFISDIPTELIASFSATLKDMIQADVVLVVSDISHPDLVWQRRTVTQTLAALQLPENLAKNIIEVNNKVDLLESLPIDDGHMLPVSTVTGEGLPRLQTLLEDAIIKSTNRLKKRLRIPQGDQHLSWLYKEATVTATSAGDGDSLIVDTIMTTSAYERFKQQFRNRRKPKAH